LKNIEINRQTFAFITVGIDVVSMISLYITLIIISYSQGVTKELFDSKYNKISNFTLHFTNLKINLSSIDYEINNFCEHLSKIYYFELDKVIDRLYYYFEI